MAAIKTVGTITHIKDLDVQIEERDLAEETTAEAEGGGDPNQADIDQMLVKTGQAQINPQTEMDTEPVDQPARHLLENSVED